LRHLSQRPAIDEEAKDMAAAITIALYGIHESTMKTVVAWEKRDYWTKADRFLREWEWANVLANELDTLVRTGQWARLPSVMARLMPYFVDIETKKMTRPRSYWIGAFDRLVRKHQDNGS
jgi:hypothetical protein